MVDILQFASRLAELTVCLENHNTDTLTHHVFLGEMVEMSKGFYCTEIYSFTPALIFEF